MQDLRAFDDETKTALLGFVQENPSNRRVSSSEQTLMIDWLAGNSRPLASQQESSRRNYVRKAFAWDERDLHLIALGKDSREHRIVVVIDSIADVVEAVHIGNDHLGWDATWRDVSSAYYGIMRADVIFLLKRCFVCAQDPSKRAKNPKNDQYFDGTRKRSNTQGRAGTDI